MLKRFPRKKNGINMDAHIYILFNLDCHSHKFKKGTQSTFTCNWYWRMICQKNIVDLSPLLTGKKKQTNNNHLSPSFVVPFLPVLKILPFTEGCPECQYTSRWFRSSHPEITLNPQRWGRLCGEQEDDWDGNVCCHTLLIGDFRERSHRNFQLNCEIADGKWMRISI